ncbi:hypothetical protein C8Q78DRAFT_570237 [Trametes maxima]|nr:hypothetical protein C8Q78DRAFT_570237 [Trametes maxima]
MARGHRMLEGCSTWETRSTLGPSSKKPCVGCRCMHVCCFQMRAADDASSSPRAFPSLLSVARVHYRIRSTTEERVRSSSRSPPQRRRPRRHRCLSYVPAHAKANVNGVTSAPADDDSDERDHDDDRHSSSRIPGSARGSPSSVVVTPSSSGAARAPSRTPASDCLPPSLSYNVRGRHPREGRRRASTRLLWPSDPPPRTTILTRTSPNMYRLP